MNKLYTLHLRIIPLIACFAINEVSAQNLGFEATPATSPPNNWTLVTGVWTVNTNPTYVRTGLQSMTITDPATTGTTLGTTNPVITTTSPGYLITMAWGKSNSANNALFHTGYRSGTTNNINPSTTSSGQPANITNTTWSRIISVSASSTIAAGAYGIPLRAFTSTAIAGTTLYFDDFIIYGSSSNVPDVTAPDPATGFSITSNNLSWTNGIDNGAPASGIGGVVLLRTDGVSIPAPVLNDQAMYATTTGATGSSSIVSGANTWTVIASIDGAGTTNFIDGSFTGGPYTYAVYMRDLAYNYSPAASITVASNCIDPPTGGDATAAPTVVCPGSPVMLGLTGSSFGVGQTYQWKSSSTLGGTYTNIGSAQANPALTVNPTVTTYYKAELVCSGGTPVLSNPVVVNVNLGYSGTFTINSAVPTGGTNYQTFGDAIAALTMCGITGPVVYNVDPGSGPYTEQITIPVINGTSSTNTVTINGNGRTLQFTPVTSARHVLKLDGADHVTIDSLVIMGLATDFDWGIHLTNASDSNTIRRCTVDLSANTSTTQANAAGIVASNSSTSVTTTGNNASYLTIENCTVKGGYNGIILHGLATSLNAINNRIINNTLLDNYGTGIVITQNDGTLIQNNVISRPTRTNMLSASAGIELGAANKNVLINANKIHTPHTAAMTTQSGTAYGVYLNSCDAPVGSENRITNNLVYNFSSATGIQYGLYNIGSDGAIYYHNTVVLDNAASTAGNTYAFHQTTAATNITFRNNILYVTRAGTGLKNCIRFATTTSTIISNNNVLYINSGTGTVGVGFYSTNFVTLADWKTANTNAYDQQSLDYDPQFTNIPGGDFTPTNPLIDNTGANVGVATDINGNARTLFSPDPGAYEWNSGVDLVPPGITFTPLVPTSSTANRTLTATITDLSGVQQGANGPRLYYRKSTNPTYVFDASPVKVGNDYTFTIDYANVGGVVGGTTIEYYVAAQDSFTNVSTNPSGGSGTNPPGTTPPSTPLSYVIKPLLTGTYPVGPGETYEKLTNIANALNNNLVDIGGHVIFELSANYDGTVGETFPINFNQFVTPDSTFTITIRPALGVTNRITAGDPGSGVGLAVINFSGGDRYIFDGRAGGTGTSNDWIIRNSRTAATIGGVIRFADDATYNVIRNINLESQATSTTTGVIFFNTSTGTKGNSFNSILNNNLRARTDVSILPISNGILSSGTAAAPNHDNTISGNHISDFANIGISVTATGNGNNWVISNNQLYNTITSTVTQSGITMASVNTLNTEITGNTIGGSAAGALGMWNNSGNVVVSGITVSAGIAHISNNTIANIAGTSTGTTARIRGLLLTTVNDSFHVLNNLIENLSTMSTGTGTGFNSSIAAGIVMAPSGVFGNDTIVGNTIRNISIENTTALTVTNVANGMSLVNLQNGVVANNTITDIKNKTTGTTSGQPPLAAGITTGFFANGYVVNNMISLGENENTNTQFAGIWQASIGTGGNNHRYYNNTVSVSGTSSGNISSYCFVRGVDTTTQQIQFSYLLNNILSMTRSGPASNYAIGNRGTVLATGWSSNYNDLYSSQPTTIGQWGPNGYDFPTWQTTSGQDANSVSIAPVFVSATNLHLSTAVNASLDNKGIPIPGLTTDFDGQTRSAFTPDLGADEFTSLDCPNVSATTWTGAINTAWENPGNWTCGLPTISLGGIIPAGSVVVISSQAVAKSLAVNPTASVTVNPGFNLIINN